ncbi:MAG: Mor transcription activator family protein [Aeromonas veronii]
MKLGYDELLANPEFFDAFKKSLPRIKGTTLDDLYSCIGRKIKEHGLCDDVLQAKLFFTICEVFGGSNFYLPSGLLVKKMLGEVCIFKEFNGANVHSLALKYGVSDKNISCILERQRRLQKEARDHLDRIGVNHA